jgi:hypothetical protein
LLAKKKKKKKPKKKKKVKPVEMLPPTTKEIATANAYGGMAIGRKKRKGVKEDTNLLSR